VRRLNIASMILYFYVRSPAELANWLVGDGYTTYHNLGTNSPNPPLLSLSLKTGTLSIPPSPGPPDTRLRRRPPEWASEGFPRAPNPRHEWPLLVPRRAARGIQRFIQLSPYILVACRQSYLSTTTVILTSYLNDSSRGTDG